MTQFYQSLLTTYSTSSLPAQCITPKYVLGNLSEISRQVAIRCPATIMDSLKTICSFVRHLGSDLLKMGFDYYMMIASVIAMPAALIPPAQPGMLDALVSMLATYFEAFVDLFLKDLVPLLESATNMILCSSSFGKIILVVLQGLCEFYNVVISRVIQGVWCYITMPSIITIFHFVESLARLGGEGPANAVQAISNALGGGNTPEQCAAGFQTQTTCTFGCNPDTNASSSTFLPQVNRLIEATQHHSIALTLCRVLHV